VDFQSTYKACQPVESGGFPGLAHIRNSQQSRDQFAGFEGFGITPSSPSIKNQYPFDSFDKSYLMKLYLSKHIFIEGYPLVNIKLSRSPLTAKADTGSIFDGWTEARCSSTGGCGNHGLAQERYRQPQLDPNGVRRLLPVHLEGLCAVRRCIAITIQAESSLANFD